MISCNASWAKTIKHIQRELVEQLLCKCILRREVRGVSFTCERGCERWSRVVAEWLQMLWARRGNCCCSTPLTYSECQSQFWLAFGAWRTIILAPVCVEIVETPAARKWNDSSLMVWITSHSYNSSCYLLFISHLLFKRINGIGLPEFCFVFEGLTGLSLFVSLFFLPFH